MPGGITDVPVSKENSLVTEELGRYAVDEYNKKANAFLEFRSVVSVKEQIVAGTMYYLTIEAVLDDEKKLYLAKVWVKPWMNFKELQDFKPVADSETKTILGGITDVPISKENSLEIEELGRYAVDEYNKKANALLEFSSVVSAKEQIVAGTMYYLTIEAIQDGEKKLYQAKVVDKPWMNFKELEDFKPLLDSEPADTSTATA
jgi:hypothetical protein